MKNKRTKKVENSIDKVYKAVLYPNDDQKTQIAKTLGCCRYVYNHFLDERIKAYKTDKKSIRFTEQQDQLPQMKKEEATKWLKEVDSTALQSSLRNLQNAFDNFFAGIKSNRKVGYPKFKCKHDSKASYRTINNNDSIKMMDDKHIQLPKLGIVKCNMPRLPQGKILNATITREVDDVYSLSVMCEVPSNHTVESTETKAIGVDLGLKKLAITSDGQMFDNPKTYEKNLKKLRRESRRLSRKPKDSKNRAKQRKKLNKLHRYIKNQRLDAIHKMTHELVERYDIICIETLNVSKMLKDRHLSRAISDASFGEIRRQFEYKTDWNGKKLIKINQWFPSSQTCHSCGYVNSEVKNLKIRYWKCPYCGEEHDRDINAAINILQEGISQIS